MDRIERALELARGRRAEVPLAPVAAPAALRSPVEESRAQPGVAAVVAVDVDALRERRVVLPRDRGAAAAAYRMLRTQLLQVVREQGLRTIGVVSTVSGEGKTLTATNLALALAAESSFTVVLADLDLRRPALAELLGLAPRVGIEQCLAGDARLEDVVMQLDCAERLLVLPARGAVESSSELLASAQARGVLRELREAGDDRLLLLDLPPLLLADDVLTLAPLLDGVLLVTAEGRTRREDLARVKELLGPLKLVGTVLNRASDPEQRAY